MLKKALRALGRVHIYIYKRYDPSKILILILIKFSLELIFFSQYEYKETKRKIDKIF